MAIPAVVQYCIILTSRGGSEKIRKYSDIVIYGWSLISLYIFKGRIDDLIERLKEARDAKSNLEEGFRQEVRAQTRLADLHQKQASDAEEKSQKLTGNYCLDLTALYHEFLHLDFQSIQYYESIG